MTGVIDESIEQHRKEEEEEDGRREEEGWSVKSWRTVLHVEGVGKVTSGWKTASDGLVAGVAPLPANQVSRQHDEDQTGQSSAHYDRD